MNCMYNTLFDMMNDREFFADKKINNNIEFEDFDIIFKKGTKQCLICYINNAKVGINHIKSIIESLEKINCSNVILIYSLIVTSFAKQFVETSTYNIELFHESYFLKNITKHYLVPKHKLIKVEDTELLLKELQIKSCNLPKIKKQDPISRYYGSQLNDVFEITRYDNDIKTLYYRIVY